MNYSFSVPNDIHKRPISTSTSIISSNSPNNLTISSISTHREKTTKKSKIRPRSNSSNKSEVNPEENSTTIEEFFTNKINLPIT